MSSKVKRKVTVENKDSGDQPRRPSVFERLGPGAVSIPTQSQDRHSRNEIQEKCRNWLRTGICPFGNTCRFQHDPYPNSSRRGKTDKEIHEKDLRHKVRSKRDDTKESRTGSVSPKRKGSKRNSSRSRKGEHESKIKSTVVVTRPRSPAAKNPDPEEREKKKTDGNWDDDSDDWPIDSAQLDYKEELTLERKRQQLQRELELEIQKEKMLKERDSVTITKTVSFSESSSSSSSSDSGSISSSSDSSSSSSGDDSEDTSSSSSSSSSSASRPPVKRKIRKPASGKEIEKGADVSSRQKPREDYDKLKSSRAAKCSLPKRSPVHSPDPKLGKKTRERRTITPPLAPSPKHRHTHPHESGSGVNRGNTSSRTRGPRTPSPPASRKQRQWEQSSSADSQSADNHHSHAKRHKKKKDFSRNDVYKSDRPPTPPPLSSPNRTALLPANQFGKKARQRADDFASRSRQRGREPSPPLLSKISGHSNSPSVRMLGNQGHHSSERDKSIDKHGMAAERLKQYSRKPVDDLPPPPKRSNSRERSMKRSRLSPRREGFKETFSPLRDRGEGESYMSGNSRKPYASPVPHFEKGDDKGDRRKLSASPLRTGKDSRDRRSLPFEPEKKRDYRDVSPRNSRDNFTRNSDPYGYNKKEDPKARRGMSPDLKKGRDDKGRDRGLRERNLEHEPVSWNEDHKKSATPTSGSRATDSRGWQEVPQIPSASRPERSRERERDRKKGKDRDIPLRSVEDGDRDRQRLPSPMRTRSPIHSHHSMAEVEPPVPSQRSRMYDPDIPPGERDYGYGYDSHRDSMYMNDRLLPTEYGQEVMRGSSLYGSEPYSEGRYRRDAPIKDQGSVSHIDRVGNYGGRDGLSSRDLHPSRDQINLSGRNDDFIPEMPMDDRHPYDERWNRNRPVRDDWDPYPTLPSSSLPPHVTARRGICTNTKNMVSPVFLNNLFNIFAALGEDRYGMPRRRRASPGEWLRTDDREMPSSQLNHRPGNHSSLPPNQRTSRSPQPKRAVDGSGQSRASWGEHSSRHSSRNNDNRVEVPLKQPLLDDKKVRNSRRDRRDRSKRRDGPVAEVKPQIIVKEKPINKRPLSPSPPLKEVKKKKDDVPPSNILPPTDKNPIINKRSREEPKSEQKPVVSSRNNKPAEPPSPKGSSNSRSSFQEKVDAPPKAPSTPAKIPIVAKVEKEERKRQRGNEEKTQADDDFSDWSDGDDDLLNRDDFNEIDIDDNEKPRIKQEEDREKTKKSGPNSVEAAKTSDVGTRQSKELPAESKSKVKDNRSQPHSRNQSKERASDEFSGSNKDGDASQDLKEYEAIDSFMVKDETDVDVDEYITTESVDYDPISDDELDALIEEPDDSLVKQNDQSENMGIVDALDVNWSTLMNESLSKSDYVQGLARRRFKVAHVLSRIGFSQTLAGPELSKKIVKFCQNQLDQEAAEQNENSNSDHSEGQKKFVMEHPVAAFHVAISQSKKERSNIFSHLGPFRRALCARKDLHIRKLLCKPTSKLDHAPTAYSQQHNVDKELYKKSIELLKMKKMEYQSRTVNVC